MNKLSHSEILEAIENHVEQLDRSMKGLMAANDGMCAALTAPSPKIDGESLAILFDLILEGMRGELSGIQNLLEQAQ